jgi:hypothetical protein
MGPLTTAWTRRERPTAGIVASAFPHFAARLFDATPRVTDKTVDPRLRATGSSDATEDPAQLSATILIASRLSVVACAWVDTAYWRAVQRRPVRFHHISVRMRDRPECRQG